MESKSSVNKNRKPIIVVVVVAIIILLTVGYFIFRPKQYDTFTDLLVLRHGYSCNREVESIRRNISLTIENIFLRHGLPLLNSVGSYFVESGLTDRGVELCNPYELLVCNTMTEKCECGDYSLMSIYGDSAPRKIVSERGGRWRKTCRWAQGTYCIPNNVTSLENKNVHLDFGCTDGTSCKVRGSGKPCTLETFKTYMDENMKDVYNEDERETFARDLYTGKICTCQGDNYYFRVLEVLT